MSPKVWFWELSSFFVSMGSKVIKNDNGAWFNFWNQYIANVGRKGWPSMAPFITQGATNALWLNPAINVCVFQLPNGASISRRVHFKAHPRNRVRLVFAEVSSMKTMMVEGPLRNRYYSYKPTPPLSLNHFPSH